MDQATVLKLEELSNEAKTYSGQLESLRGSL